ncbi:MAG TPA: DUF1659 domain-containing protein [Bacillota bacterium]|jgi:hypothetical protein|nr:DUF1659 domain-containing protein [Bacillota bacterium]HOA34878.1 DUF1659 domain-containing protein [Bacillota bacterium]HOJ83804.1 DUF1659 domain-containing protein [Bacillota bacterium]HOL14588.1 DUF1659 domain-containing protein [Bacillota bacterium]HPZ10782.1 DUF1659 domain-containing protein [Bacillota bacterium]
MAVTAIPLGSRLQLRLRTGLTQDGKPILRTRSYANLKSAASDEDLYQTGLELASMQVHALEIIRRVDEVELEEV